MEKNELIIKAKQIGNPYADKLLEDKILSVEDRASLHKIISGSFADGYINGHDAGKK